MIDLATTVREVRRAGRTRSALMRRTFPATVRQLWDACTTLEPLARWIGRLDGDPATGPAPLVTGDSVVTVTVLRCLPPYHLELLWGFPGEADSVVHASIRAVEGGAELTVEHFAPLDVAGWEGFMAGLGAHLGAPGRAAREAWAAVDVTPDTRWGDLDGSAYRLAREFDVAAAALWDAVATPSGLAGWFGRWSPDGRRWTVEFDGGGTARG